MAVRVTPAPDAAGEPPLMERLPLIVELAVTASPPPAMIRVSPKATVW